MFSNYFKFKNLYILYRWTSHVNVKKRRTYAVGFYEDLMVKNNPRNSSPIRLINSKFGIKNQEKRKFWVGYKLGPKYLNKEPILKIS